MCRQESHQQVIQTRARQPINVPVGIIRLVYMVAVQLLLLLLLVVVVVVVVVVVLVLVDLPLNKAIASHSYFIFRSLLMMIICYILLRTAFWYLLLLVVAVGMARLRSFSLKLPPPSLPYFQCSFTYIIACSLSALYDDLLLCLVKNPAFLAFLALYTHPPLLVELHHSLHDDYIMVDDAANTTTNYI